MCQHKTLYLLLNDFIFTYKVDVKLITYFVILYLVSYTNHSFCSCTHLYLNKHNYSLNMGWNPYIFLMPSSLSCGYSHLFDPPFGSYSYGLLEAAAKIVVELEQLNLSREILRQILSVIKLESKMFINQKFCHIISGAHPAKTRLKQTKCTSDYLLMATRHIQDPKYEIFLNPKFIFKYHIAVLRI